MKANKFGIPVIVVLLLIFVPAAIYGVYYGSVLEREGGNPSHQKKLDGKLYFYDSSDKLIGLYTCQNENCDEAMSIVDDEVDFGYEFGQTPIGVLGESSVFVRDGEKIYYLFLKGTEEAQNMGEFELVKDYSGRFSSIVIVKNTEGKYGIYDKTGGTIVMGFEYDFIGANSLFDQTKFITVKDGKYNITTNEGTNVLAPSSMPIYDFDDSFIYFYDKAKGSYIIRNSEGKTKLAELNIKSYRKNDQVFAVITDTGMVIYDYSLSYEYQKYAGVVTDVSVEGNTVYFTLDGKEKTFSPDGES